MGLKQITHGSTEYQKMLQLRNEVLRMPLGLTFTEEELLKEKNDILIGAFDEDRILGCCMLTAINEKTIKLRQMAVQKSQQGKGIGEALLNFTENIARDKGYTILIMHARSPAIGFYEKMGYNIVGEQFTEVSISHYFMKKNL